MTMLSFSLQPGDLSCRVVILVVFYHVLDCCINVHRSAGRPLQISSEFSHCMPHEIDSIKDARC